MATEVRDNTANGVFSTVTGIGSAPHFFDVKMGHSALFIKNSGSVAVEITFKSSTPAGTIWDSVASGGSIKIPHNVASGFWARALSGSGDLFVVATDLRVHGGIE